MLETVFLVIILSIIPLVRYSTKLGDGYGVKNTLFVLAGLLYLGISFFMGFNYVSTMSGNLLFMYVLLCTASMAWAVNFEQAWQDVAKWWAMYALFVMSATIPANTVLLLAMIPIPLFLAMGFMQDVYPGIDLFDEPTTNRISTKGKTSFFLGSIGNTNHSASFLAPYFFISIYLSTNVSPYFFIFVPFILFGIYRTKCHIAWFGVVMGSFFLYPPYSLIAGAACFAVGGTLLVIYRKRVFESNKLQNFNARIYYWIVAFRLWKRNPILGYGLRGYRKEIYDEQGKMNAEGGKYNHLVTIDGTYLAFPTRTHNDFVEAAVETGTIGLIVFIGFIASLFYAGISAGNWCMVAGLACLVVCGMMFYPMSSFTCVPYMVIASTISGAGITIFTLPLAIGCVLTAFLAKLAITYVINHHLSSVWFARAFRGNDIEQQNINIDKAVALAPTEGAILFQAINIKRQFDPVLAMYYAERALHYADGTMKMWAIWAIYGDMQARTGNWIGAKRSIAYSLLLNPLFKEAKLIKEHMEEIERQGKERAEAEQKKIRNEQISNLVLPHRRRDVAWR